MQTTSLNFEVERMSKIVKERVANFQENSKSAKLPIQERIVRILLKASQKELAPENLLQLERAVQNAVYSGGQVPLAFLWGMGGHARSTYKLCEQVCLPRLADFWIFFWLDILNRKIQTVYRPGLEVVIADEVPQLEILGFSPEEIKMRRSPLEAICKEFAPFVRIVELPWFKDEICDARDCEPDPHLVYSILTSMNWGVEIPSEVYEWHYRKRVKPWEEIHALLPPDVWEKASELQKRMQIVWKARKKADFFGKLFNGRPFIDAALTDKGRWSPDAWNEAFPQHGGSVLDAREGRFSIKIVPEARLANGGYDPFAIAAADFAPHTRLMSGVSEKSFTFYWVARKGVE